MDKLAKSLGIENLSRSQVSEMTKGLNEQVQSFRERPLVGEAYPVLWVDALYEKVRYGGRVVSMAIQIVCGVNAQGRREVLAVEPMLEESKDTYQQLFECLKERGLQMPSLIVSNAHKGLIAAIRTSFVGASWQRCKVHFIPAVICHRRKASLYSARGTVQANFLGYELEVGITVDAGSIGGEFPALYSIENRLEVKASVSALVGGGFTFRIKQSVEDNPCAVHISNSGTCHGGGDRSF